MIDVIITFLKYHLQNKPAVIGLSGGVDSAVVAYLLSKTIPAKQIYGLIMPTATNQSQDIEDAQSVAEQLGINFELIQLDSIIAAYPSAMQTLNLPARIRMALLYSKANTLNGLVVGTGNKSELLTGYFTKYGDGGVDLLPIGHLYKTQVWQLAKQLGVLQRIIDKTPTAGLKPNQTDEQDLGMSYQDLDVILQALMNQTQVSHFPETKVQRVQQLITAAQHKLKPIPIP